MKIGIMGGSFDPIHVGHLKVAEQMREKRRLGKLVFIPTNIPPHKAHRQLAAPRHRLRMVELAIADYPGFEVSRVEIDHEGPSYSIDTIDRLQDEWGDGHSVFFIIGADTLAELSVWRRPRELIEQADFLTAVRPGTEMDFWDELSFTFTPEQVERLRDGCVDTTPVDISSTDIRDRVRRERPISGLVPPAVEEYIMQHGLYRARRGESK